MGQLTDVPIDPVLLSLLRCPETRQPLTPAPHDLLARFQLEEGLLRADGKLLFPVRAGIPILLLEEAIRIDGFSPAQPPASRAANELP